MTWPTKKLGEVADVFNGKTFPKDDYSNFGGLKTIKVKDFNEETIYFNKDENGWVNKEVEEKLILRKGDTLIINAAHSSSHVGGKIGYCNEIPPIRSFLSGEIMILRAKGGIEPLLLNSLIRSHSLRRKIKDLVRGIHLYPKDVSGLKIPLPPLKIQKQIVERLDKIAEAQKLNNELIQKSDDLFQSLLHKELNPTGKNWERKKISEIVSVAGNKFIPKKIKRSEYQVGGLYPVVDQGANLISGYINEKDYLYKGNLPIIIFGDHTRIFKFIDFPFAVGADGTKTLVSKFENALSHYLYYTLLGFKIENLGYKRHFSILKQKTISIPPIKEQKQIVEKLSAAQECKKQLLAQKSKLKELFESVLNKSFKGELVR